MALDLRRQNPELTHTVRELERAARANEAPIWRAVARQLARPRHQSRPVNVGHLGRSVGAGEVVVVPGKLLADGRVEGALTVAAFQCSPAAREKIEAAGGRVVTIHELLRSTPKGTGVRLFA